MSDNTVPQEVESSQSGRSPTRGRAAPPEVEPLLIGVETVAKMTGYSRRTVEKWLAMDALPPPVKLPGPGKRRSLRWRKSDIEEWIDAGCPTAKVWAARKATARK
ncbi:MAG: helix-turn-helix domain-containing protein [Bacteroidales bacterium]|nr:helix-turn-helix domain-containing protein [Bacteroidales bacterium]